MNDTAWPSGGQFDHPEQQDFNFLDLDSIDLDNFDFGAANANNPSPQLDQLTNDLDLQHLHNPYSPAAVSQEHRNGAQQAHSLDGRTIAQPAPHYFEFTMAPYNQNAPAFTQPQDQVFRPHAPVPPTPNSIEMHPDQARYMQQFDAQQAMFDQRYPMVKDDMVCLKEKKKLI
jgi:hypothetical protein